MSSLVFIGDELLTVSGVVGPTLAEVLDNVQVAYFHSQSGGTIFHRIGTPSNTGANGEIGQVLDDHWEIWGNDNIKAFKMIKRSGQADALIGAQYWGSAR